MASGNINISSGGGGAGVIAGSVSVYASLPTPIANYSGQLWFVDTGSGGFLSWVPFTNIYKYPVGLYTPNEGNTAWILTPINVHVAEDAFTLVNITNWAEWVSFSFDINIGDRLIYNNATYENLTGTQIATAPDTDLTNWAYPIMFSRSMTFDTTYTPGSPTAGTIWYNNAEYTINIETGLGPTIQVGQEILLLYYNNTGVDIPNFSVLRPLAAVDIAGFIVPTPELAQANIFSKCEGTLGVATQLIPDGQLGFAVRFGRARDGDTSGFTPGDGLWLSEITAGLLTNVSPEFPNYKISMGGALNSDNGDGQVFVSVTRNVFDTFNSAWDGCIRESIDFLVSSNGSVITGSLSNIDDTLDLTLIFSDGFSTFDTTPAATIALTAGTDTNPQTNFVYILKSNKILTISTSEWPDAVEHIKIAEVVVQSAVATQLDGALRNQNWNDHVKREDDNGHLLHISEKLRQFEAQWSSGTAGVVDIDSTPAPDAVTVRMTPGIIYQLHQQSIAALNMKQYTIDAVTPGLGGTFTISDDGDLSSAFPDGQFINVHNSTGNDLLYTVASTVWSSPNFIITVNETIASAVVDGTIGDDIHVVNHPVTPYKTTLDLNTETVDATNITLNNRSFSFIVWGVVNKSGQASHLMLNLPAGSYNSTSNAISDTLNYSVYSIPSQFQGVGFLIARFTFSLSSAAGGTWTLEDTEDLRGKVPNTTAGGGAGGTGVTEFIGLTDTNNAYTSQAGRFAVVNAGETAFPFATDLFWDEGNGRLGIGTGTPSDSLEITNGAIKFSGDAAFVGNEARIYADTDSGVVFSAGDGTARDLLIASQSGAQVLEIPPAANDLALVMGAGNVGIKTITPNDALDVNNGAIRLSGVSSYITGESRLYKTAANGLVITAGVGTGRDFVLTSRSGGQVLEIPPNTADLALGMGGGSVGVGTSTPEASLHVFGVSSTNMAGISSIALPILGSGVEEGAFVVKVGLADKWAQSIVNYHTDGKGLRVFNTGDNAGETTFEVAQGAGTKFIVAGQGNVGIGTSDPSSVLEAVTFGTNSQTTIRATGYNDQAAFTPALQIRKSHSDIEGTLVSTIDTEELGQVRFLGVDAAAVGFDDGAIIRAIQNGVAGAKVPTNLILTTFSATAENINQLVLHSDGNVGIGTATPTHALDITGAVRATIGRVPADKFHSDLGTQNTLFDILAPFVPNINDELILNGSYEHSAGETLVTSYVERTSATVLTLYGFDIAGTSILAVTVTDGGSTPIDTSLAW